MRQRLNACTQRTYTQPTSVNLIKLDGSRCRGQRPCLPITKSKHCSLYCGIDIAAGAPNATKATTNKWFRGARSTMIRSQVDRRHFYIIILFHSLGYHNFYLFYHFFSSSIHLTSIFIARIYFSCSACSSFFIIYLLQLLLVINSRLLVSFVMFHVWRLLFIYI